jgi:hypothetical protein
MGQTQTGAALGRESTAVLLPFDTLSGNPFLDYPQLGSLRVSRRWGFIKYCPILKVF